MSDAYTRLYHRFPEEFPHIYGDDRAFACWVRLLLLADASWPMHPPLPRSVRPKMLALLQGAGLVIVQGDHYTIRGLDAERTRRRDAARTGASVRWHSERTSDRNATASAGAMHIPSKSRTEQETSTKKTPPPPAERGRRKDGANPRAKGTAPRQQAANPRANGTSTRQIREDQKRGPTSLHQILSAINRGEPA